MNSEVNLEVELKVNPPLEGHLHLPLLRPTASALPHVADHIAIVSKPMVEVEGNVVGITEANLKVHCKPRSRKTRQCPGLLPKVGRAGAHSVTASIWEPAYSLRGWLVPIPSLFASLWFTSFTSVCFLQLPHFALTVWFSKNKEETGKEIRVQDGSGEMCLDVRVFRTKWWLPGGQPASAQLGKKRTNGKNR